MVQNVVAEHYNIKLSDMKSKRRTEILAVPRQIAMYIARELTNESHISIGEAFGGKDHSTVIHAINKIKAKVSSDPFFNAEINKIIKKIKND
ncbi:MAG: Chromosomal replication initiator protein DnaA [Syntrophomonadaceae bacterium]|nr:Chromosomal replication initiator protein DnaA [Bacillota bacterium]